MKLRKIYPYFLVVVQFSCIIYLLVTKPLIAATYDSMLVEFAGLFLGIYAIVVMKPGNFNITPLPVTGGKLVSKGPYRYIRHPMYFAILLTLSPLVIDYFSIDRVVVFALLVADLLIKIQLEEKKLKEKFDSYEAYAAKTKKLLPFLY